MSDEVFLIALTIIAATVLILAQVIRFGAKRPLYRAITAAIEANSPVLADLIARLDRRPWINDVILAYVLIAIALAMIGFGLISGDINDIKRAASGALFPGFVGTALLVYRRWAKEPGAED